MDTYDLLLLAILLARPFCKHQYCPDHAQVTEC